MTTDDNIIQELTEMGNAMRLATQHCERMIYTTGLGWMIWNGKYWQRSEQRAIALAKDTARSIYCDAANTSNEELQKAIVKWAKRSQNAQTVRNMLYLAKCDLEGQTEQFDQQTMLLPVLNGVVDLTSGNLIAHDPGHYNSRLSRVRYDPDATCPTWLAFLERIQPEPTMREFIQRLAGYSLTGSTEEQCLMFCHGVGRNGKSVLIETIASLLGDYHTATRIETLGQKTHGGGVPNDVAALSGSRMVTVSETPEGARLNESLVKDMTGGDLISARFMRAEYFQFRPQFKLWIRGNHKPQIYGTDDGIWRRLVLLPFDVQIPPNETDSTLANTLLDELSGILNWAVQGCLAWQEIGLNPPQNIIDAVEEYRTEMDILGQFIDDCCVRFNHANVSAMELYQAYRDWADDNGVQSVSQRRFGLSLRERGYRKEKMHKVRWYGIGLQADYPTDFDQNSSGFKMSLVPKPEPEK